MAGRKRRHIPHGDAMPEEGKPGEWFAGAQQVKRLPPDWRCYDKFKQMLEGILATQPYEPRR